MEKWQQGTVHGNVGVVVTVRESTGMEIVVVVVGGSYGDDECGEAGGRHINSCLEILLNTP